MLLEGGGQIHTQSGFDSYHRTACERLPALYREFGFYEFSIGQAQKWINMTFKYIFTLGEERLPGYGQVYQFCHVPIDNVVIDQLTRYGFPPLRYWSRLDDYDLYLAYQKRVRQCFDLLPLDVEFLLWLDRAVDAKPSA